MKSKIIIVLILMASFAYCDKNGKLSCRVFDISTNKPLVGAKVEIIDTNLTMETDSTGRCIFTAIPPGVYSMRAFINGYNHVTITKIKSIMDLKTSINFRLTENGRDTIIEATRKWFDINGGRIMTAAEIERLPT